VFTKHVLTLVGVDGAVLQNDVIIIVNCYDVIAPSPDVCKSDIYECNFIEKPIEFIYWNYIL